MTTNIGVAPTTVDNTTIQFNTSTGAIQVKDQGITAAKIANNTITGNQLAAGVLNWTLLDTLTLTASTGGTSNNVAAYGSYRLVFNFKMGGSNSGQFHLRINGNSGSIYRYTKTNGTTGISTNNAQTGIEFVNTTDTTDGMYGEMIMSGLTPAVASGAITIGMTGFSDNNGHVYLGARAALGNAQQVQNFTIVRVVGTNETLTGTMQIYGA